MHGLGPFKRPLVRLCLGCSEPPRANRIWGQRPTRKSHAEMLHQHSQDEERSAVGVARDMCELGRWDTRNLQAEGCFSSFFDKSGSSGRPALNPQSHTTRPSRSQIHLRAGRQSTNALVPLMRSFPPHLHTPLWFLGRAEPWLLRVSSQGMAWFSSHVSGAEPEQRGIGKTPVRPMPCVASPTQNNPVVY